MSDQEPPLTYEHVIGQQQLEIIMLKRELASVQRQLAECLASEEAPASENGSAPKAGAKGARKGG